LVVAGFVTDSCAPKWWRLLPSQEGLRKFLALIFAECQLLKDSVNADSAAFSIG
jgi:hypothetical protein